MCARIAPRGRARAAPDRDTLRARLARELETCPAIRRARAVADGGVQGVQVEPPLAVDHVHQGQARHGADQPDAVQHARVGGIGEDDLVAGIGEAEERVDDGLPFAARDDDLALAVVARTAASLAVVGHGLLAVVAPRERQPAAIAG